MNRDDDIDVPNLGPAEPAGEARQTVVASGGQTRARAEEEVSTSGGGISLIQSLVIIILITAVCALGYFGFDMYQAQQQRAVTFQQAQDQIEQLKELLKQAEQGAAASGEALQGNVSTLESSLKEKDKQLDSEIAKLWVIAHQRNKPALEKQASQLASLEKSLAAQEKQIKALSADLQKQEKQLKAAAAREKEIAQLKKSITAEVAQLSKQVSRVETDVRTAAELTQEQLDELLQSQRSLTDRVVKLEGRSTGDLERRVKLNEQAVRAFDSTRRQLNQELLSVKQRLNNMQLQLEQR
ncbi:hypothetical protein [Neptuniibacter halophilus]|uniref:hypothetical protein n=1 Tax=Neptuniibacter halophilus TaxID=651666 RepID=UPI002574499E|nr:hypothetical protein [Neptuniibacter halophilus]